MVYLDVLLLTNFLTAYLLLLAAGALSGQRAPFARMLAGSALAALSALILFAPEQPYPVQVAYKAATALGITAAAFGWRSRRRLVTAACWYAALNIALAGAVLLVILRTGTRVADTANLTVYLRVSPLLLLALSGACCAAVELGLRILHPAGGTHQTAGLELELCGQPVRLRAALDTGCHLRDPVTCLPVLLISWPAAKGRLPGGSQRLFGAVVPGPAPQYAAGRCQSAGDTLQYRCAARAAAGVCGGGYQHHHRNGDAKPWPHRRCFLARSRSSPANMKLYMAQIFS